MNNLYIHQLETENKQLRKALKSYEKGRYEEHLRIEMAIEYIKNYLPNYDFDHSNLEKLLEILGDKE